MANICISEIEKDGKKNLANILILSAIQFLKNNKNIYLFHSCNYFRQMWPGEGFYENYWIGTQLPQTVGSAHGLFGIRGQK